MRTVASGPIGRVTRLQFNVPSNTVVTPPAILALVLAVSIVVSLIVQRASGVSATDPGYVSDMQWNAGVIWSLPGFLIYLGVQSVATQFPFALALGCTRRSFALGTLLSHLVISIYLAALGAIGLGIEILTGHWFSGVYMFDTRALGGGSAGILMLTLFLVALVSLSVGGAFGAVWGRFGARGPLVVAIVLALALALGVLASVPAWPWIGAHFARWWLLAAAMIVSGLAVLGELLCLRRTSVR